jgi:tryptophan synthase alpha chain
MIPEESSEIRSECRKMGLSLIHLAAPNTPAGRLKDIDRASTGFVYVVSIAGVTGARKALPASIKPYLVSTAKHIKNNPKVIGFGISSGKQIKELKRYVDGFIVASALIDIIRRSKNTKEAYSTLSSFIRSLRRALDN